MNPMFQIEDITPRHIPVDEMTNVDDNICDTQGELFALAARKHFDMEDFVEKYMNSRFCNMEMDALYSRMQMAWSGECMDNLLTEITPKKDPDPRPYNEDIVSWIGWAYRLLSISHGIRSRDIYKVFPWKKMIILYEGYHTQGERYIVECLGESLMG